MFDKLALQTDERDNRLSQTLSEHYEVPIEEQKKHCESLELSPAPGSPPPEDPEQQTKASSVIEPSSVSITTEETNHEPIGVEEIKEVVHDNRMKIVTVALEEESKEFGNEDHNEEFSEEGDDEELGSITPFDIPHPQQLRGGSDVLTRKVPAGSLPFPFFRHSC